MDTRASAPDGPAPAAAPAAVPAAVPVPAPAVPAAVPVPAPAVPAPAPAVPAPAPVPAPVPVPAPAAEPAEPDAAAVARWNRMMTNVELALSRAQLALENDDTFAEYGPGVLVDLCAALSEMMNMRTRRGRVASRVAMLRFSQLMDNLREFVGRVNGLPTVATTDEVLTACREIQDLFDANRRLMASPTTQNPRQRRHGGDDDEEEGRRRRHAAAAAASAYQSDA